MKKKKYQVKFGSTSTIGDVSFDASHDSNAIKRVGAIAKEINLPNTAWMLWEGGRLVKSMSSDEIRRQRGE